METKNIMIVGVGGQGSLLASKLWGHLLMEQGCDVKVSEVHGMSQRGGSVVTYVRYGDKVNSPVIDKGERTLLSPSSCWRPPVGWSISSPTDRSSPPLSRSIPCLLLPGPPSTPRIWWRR